MAKKGSSAGKTLLFFGIFLIVLVGAGFGLRAAGIIGGAEEGVSVETEKAKLKTITQLVSASGKIQPEVEVIIRPDVSGEIIELAVNEGDFVRKGDLLVRLKPDIFKARIDDLNAALLTQKARLEQARASLIQAEAAHLKNKELYEKDIISELDFIQTKSNYDSQKASLKASQYQIQSAEAQLRKAEEELEQTVIRAPQDGTVTGLAVEFGERVLGNSQMAGTEMMRVSLLDKMEVLVEVNENDIVNISALDTTRIEVDAYPERRFNGIVTEIANSANLQGTSIDQVTNFEVKVRILKSTYASLMKDSTMSPFRPGMTASLDILTDRKQGVLAVPIQAVTTRADTSDVPEYKRKKETDVDDDEIFEIVFVNNGGEAELRVVETGIQDDENIVILSGLQEGEEIITGPWSAVSKTLRPNSKIRAKEDQPEEE